MNNTQGITTFIKRNPLETIAAVSVFVALVFGGIVFVTTKAASFYAYADVSQASLSEGAELVSDSTAIGGKAIEFASATVGGNEEPAATSKYLNPYGLGLIPYNYIPWQGSLSDFENATGVKNQVAAFIISSSGCTPAWDGNSSLGLGSSRSNEIASQISTVKNSGGDIMISLGGASGNELAYTCSDKAQLKQAYANIINTYGVNKLDFDIEGSNASNTTANARRAEVVAELQNEIPGLKIWVTLPVEKSGLTSEGIGVVEQMREKGVVLSGVNIMAMDYGTNTTDMGAAAVSAANSTFSQLKSIYPESSDSDIWKTVGVTAMIGINDTQPETFTLANAQTLRDFAVQKGVGMLSYWNVMRDVSCSGNQAILSDSCSGIAQSRYEFADVLGIPELH